MMKKKKKILAASGIIAAVLILSVALRICCGYIPYHLSKEEKQQAEDILYKEIKPYFSMYDGYFENNCFVSGEVYSVSRKVWDWDNIVISLAYTANEYVCYKDKCYSVSYEENYINLIVKLGNEPEIIDIETCEDGMNYSDSIFSMYAKISPWTYLSYIRKSITNEISGFSPSGIFDKTCDEQAEEYFGILISEHNFDYDPETGIVRVWDWDENLNRSVTIFEEKYK